MITRSISKPSSRFGTCTRRSIISCESNTIASSKFSRYRSNCWKKSVSANAAPHASNRRHLAIRRPSPDTSYPLGSEAEQPLQKEQLQPVLKQFWKLQFGSKLNQDREGAGLPSYFWRSGCPTGLHFRWASEKRGLVLLRSFGKGNITAAQVEFGLRRRAEDACPIIIEFALPSRNHQGGEGVTNEVHARSAHIHDRIDAKTDRDAGRGDRRGN